MNQGINGVGSNGYPFFKITQLRKPSHYYSCVDGEVYQFYSSNYFKNVTQGNSTSNTVDPRHNGKRTLNIMFTDGHVDSNSNASSFSASDATEAKKKDPDVYSRINAYSNGELPWKNVTTKFQ